MLILAFLSGLATAIPLNSSSLYAPLTRNHNAIPGQYMVTFKDGHTLGHHEAYLGLSLSDAVRHSWDVETSWPPFGYSASLDEPLLTLIRADPMVAFVEEDFFMSLVQDGGEGIATPHNISTDDQIEKRYPTSRKNAPFNLVIASAAGRRSGRSTGSFDYDTRAQGQQVDIYIVDSGVNINHQDFGGRARNFFDATETVFADENHVGDVYGHGTEVADIAAGTRFGVASSANILSTKIVRGSGSTGLGSDAVTAIKRITQNHRKRRAGSNFRGSVINYSVDITPPKIDPSSLGDAITAADKENIIQVAAAGNSNNEAINQLPAAYTTVITVASMTEDYRLSPSSSYGTAVDIIAPGTGIIGAAANSNDGYFTISGTSFAAPLVSGVCAQFLSYSKGPRTKQDLYNMLINFSIMNQVDLRGHDDTPNRVVNNGALTRSWPPRDELIVGSKNS